MILLVVLRRTSPILLKLRVHQLEPVLSPFFVASLQADLAAQFLPFLIKALISSENHEGRNVLSHLH